MNDEQRPDQNEIVDYRSEVQGILATRVTAWNIDNYADDALDRLVDLIGRVTDSYVETEEITAKSDKELEDDALRHFGLPQMEDILTHINNLAQDINAIDDVLEEADTTYEVLTPPDTTYSPDLRPADGSYTPAEVRSLTKTVLLVLKHEYGVEVTSQAALTLVRGSVTPDMMRQQPYYLIVARELNRTILACDESKNATFVFDTQRLEQLGITSEMLGLKTKPELKDLIQNYPGIGKWLPYTETFVARFSRTIKSLAARSDASKDDERGGQYLVPDVPKPNSASVVARKIQTSTKFVEMAIRELGASLGDISYVAFEGELVANFNQEQISSMRDWLRALALSKPVAPSQYKALDVFAAEIHIGPDKVETAAQAIADFGEPSIFRVPDKIRAAFYYSPKQQEQLIAKLKEMGIAPYASELPPDVSTIERLVEASGASRQTVSRTIGLLRGQLGPITIYMSEENAKIMGFNTIQTKLILDEIKRRADQFMIAETARELGVGEHTIRRAAKAMADQLVDVAYVKKGQHQIPTYNADQRRILKEWITAQGYYKKLEEGTVSLPTYAAMRHLGHQAVEGFIAEQVREGRIPEPERYPFGSKSATYAITLELQQFLNANLPPGVPRPGRNKRDSKE